MAQVKFPLLYRAITAAVLIVFAAVLIVFALGAISYSRTSSFKELSAISHAPRTSPPNPSIDQPDVASAESSESYRAFVELSRITTPISFPAFQDTVNGYISGFKDVFEGLTGPWPRPPFKQYPLGEKQLSNALHNLGDPAPFLRLHQKLASGNQKVKIVTLGGSMTAGRDTFYEYPFYGKLDSQYYQTQQLRSWSTKFGDWLGKAYKLGPDKLEVSNESVEGSSSVFAYMQIPFKMPSYSAPDMVMMDFYINDSEVMVSDLGGVQVAVEGLIRYVKSLRTADGHAPAIVLLSTRESDTAGNVWKKFEGKLQQTCYAPLAAKYRIPLISIGDMLEGEMLPGIKPEHIWYNHFSDILHYLYSNAPDLHVRPDKNQPNRKWDHGNHCGYVTHQLVADTVSSWWVRTVSSPVYEPPLDSNINNTEWMFPPPATLTQCAKPVVVYDYQAKEANGLVKPLTHAFAVGGNWKFAADDRKKSKFGYILDPQLPPSQLPASLPLGNTGNFHGKNRLSFKVPCNGEVYVSVVYLSSYENMGKATVQMDCGDIGAYCVDGVTFGAESKQGTQTSVVDGLWTQHASLPSSVTIPCGRWHPATFDSYVHIDHLPLNETERQDPKRSTKFKVLQVIACGH